MYIKGNDARYQNRYFCTSFQTLLHKKAWENFRWKGHKEDDVIRNTLARKSTDNSENIFDISMQAMYGGKALHSKC